MTVLLASVPSKAIVWGVRVSRVTNARAEVLVGSGVPTFIQVSQPRAPAGLALLVGVAPPPGSYRGPVNDFLAKTRWRNPVHSLRRPQMAFAPKKNAINGRRKASCLQGQVHRSEA